jgi:hypothetical protein
LVIVKNPRSKTGRNALISAGVLLVLLVGGGVGYTYFVGPDATQSSAGNTAPQVSEEQVIKATKPAANAKESASVQSILSPVEPGANSSIIVKTNAGSKCTITVVYDTVASKDSGLGPKVADEFGNVSWTWTVEPAVPVGTWPVTVTCVYNTRSAVVKADLVVTKAKEKPRLP